MTCEFKYVTADTHFGHTGLNLYNISRIKKSHKEGYKNIEEYIVGHWNEIVSDDDHVLHLGDFALKDGYKMAKRLKGNVTLLKGNHDTREHLEYYKTLGWNIIDSLELNIPNALEIQQTLKNKLSPKALKNSELACLVCTVNNNRVMFSHYPVFDDNPHDEKYKDVTLVLEEIFLLTNCEFNIHGHTHFTKAKEEFCISACLELNEFEIVKFHTNFKEILDRVT